jgi:preprotein translocase subunit SecF
VLSVLLIGSNLLGATTLQSYGLALFVGLLSGAYSSIFIASPVLCLMKEREPRWVAISNRLAKRGDTGAFYSATDAANMSTQISVAAAGQVSRAGAGGGAPAATKSGGTKRSGIIRPGSADRPGSGDGAGGGGGAGTGTAVMDRPSGASGGQPATAPSQQQAGQSGQGGQQTKQVGPRPRKSKGKRRR